DVENFIASTEINETVIVGGIGAISYEVASAFPNPMRIGGKNRFETNINVLSTFGNWLSYDEVYVATGMNYPDALSGSAAAAMTGSPLILTTAIGIDPNTYIYANFLRAKKVYGLGGQAVLGDGVLSWIEELAQYLEVQNIKSEPVTVNKGQFAILPSAVFVLPDGKTINQALPKIVEIQWQTEDLVIDTSVAGEKIYTGVVKGHDINDDKYKVELKVIVK
uniref:cell wall-binding repeat-containing protein n=1 Tax=Clostridium sp. UBA6640 TaxID=1946370 RepID=UPI0025B9A147